MKTETEAAATETTETAVAAEPGASTAPKKASSKKGASKKADAPKAKKAAKPAAPKKEAKTTPKKEAKASTKAAKSAGIPQEFSKKGIVIDLLQRKGGATMAEIAKATDWQNHSIRGFISGQLTKKMGLTVESSKNEAGERTYKITK